MPVELSQSMLFSVMPGDVPLNAGTLIDILFFETGSIFITDHFPHTLIYFLCNISRNFRHGSWSPGRLWDFFRSTIFSKTFFSARLSVIFEIYIFYGIIKIDQLINQAIDLVETRPPCVRGVQWWDTATLRAIGRIWTF